MSSHSDWFDDDGLFIGSIPRVIWRPVCAGFIDYHDIGEYARVVGFAVDRQKAINHIKAISLWKATELDAWDDEELTFEIFLYVCQYLNEGMPFLLLNPDTMDNL